MVISKEELLSKLNEVSDSTSAEEAKELFDDLNDYLNDAYDGEQPWDDETGDVTPEYAAWEKKALEDLGLEESIFDTLNALQEAGNPVTSETIIDKDDDGDADVTITKQDDGDDSGNNILNVGKAVPEYEDADINAGVLSGMLTDKPEIRQATIDWMKGLTGKDSEALKNIVTSQTFKDMYGEPDWENDEPHDEGLAGDTTLEEDLMLNPSMSPSEFSKKAAEKRGAKPGEPAPDFNNFTNDIARNLASRRW